MRMNEPIPARRLSSDPVDATMPWPTPARVAHQGRYARLEPLDPQAHAADLWDATHDGPDADRTWDYLGYGPFESPEAFHDWLSDCAASSDPLFFAIRDGRTGRAAGMASYLRISPPTGNIEIGHIWFAPSLRNS